MTVQASYIMEHADEALRLDMKTGREAVEKQAGWAGLMPGMRVADIGCGSGKTTSMLNELCQPFGQAVGVDGSPERIAHAQNTYKAPGLSYCCRNFYEPLDELGPFDFIWVRFVLEYHREKAFEIVQNLSRVLKPGGILCLIDLDYNCLTHAGIPVRLEKAITNITKKLELEADFDPYMGRKLYSFLYDLNFRDIEVDLSAHHLITGQLNEVDSYNWNQKVQVAAKNSNYSFAEYAGGFNEFVEEFEKFFADPRRFTYTPLISARGIKPIN
ncbi:MAG: class I SAM-dependent methyltransferase [Desulfuromonadaceae bacterium]|nr:class I SAM-dependent methyltransferase [Desulfuromonadaceae bacterium]